VKDKTTKIDISKDNALIVWTGETDDNHETIYIMNENRREVVAIDDPVAALKLVDALTMKAASIISARGAE